jgi:hypothetical protein
MTNVDSEIQAKKTWEKPEIVELKTRLTSGKDSVGSETPAGPTTAPS